MLCCCVRCCFVSAVVETVGVFVEAVGVFVEAVGVFVEAVGGSGQCRFGNDNRGKAATQEAGHKS